MRVAAARIRQHEEARAVHGRVLKSRFDHRCLRVTEHPPQHAVHRHADERDDRRTKACNQVGHPDAPRRQAHVVHVRDGLGHDSRFVEQAPEAVGRPREVMSGRRRHHAGVDADEEHAHAGFDAIRESQIVPGGLRILGHELVV
jgi:hypothetical protein